MVLHTLLQSTVNEGYRIGHPEDRRKCSRDGYKSKCESTHWVLFNGRLDIVAVAYVIPA